MYTRVLDKLIQSESWNTLQSQLKEYFGTEMKRKDKVELLSGLLINACVPVEVKSRMLSQLQVTSTLSPCDWNILVENVFKGKSW